MHIKFYVNQSDLYNFLVLLSYKKYRLPVFLAGLVAGLITYLTLYVNTHRFADALAWGTAAGVAGGVFSAWLSRRALAMLARKAFSEDLAGQIFGWHTLELNPDGIVESTETTRTEYAWQAIDSAWFTKGYVIIFVGAAGTYVIRREFATSDFVRELRDHLPAERIRGEMTSARRIGLKAAPKAITLERTTAQDLSPSHASAASGEPKRMSQPEMRPESRRLEGTWEYTFANAPEHRQVKIINETHFVWVTYSRKKGLPLVLGGGTYTFDGSTYREFYEFGSRGLPRKLVGKEQVFTAELDGEVWTHSGTLTNGFRVSERWQRVS